MSAISDAEKSRRYRRKLEDLLKASGDFISQLPPTAFTPESRPAYERLDEERRIIRSQLDVEAQFEKRPTCDGQVHNYGPCSECGKFYD
jgi:hypothetical protein